MNHWMFRCQDVSRKVSLAMDVRLPMRQRLAIRIHLMVCRYCARFRRQLALLRKISRLVEQEMPRSASGDRLSAEAKARIKQQLRSMG